MKTKNSPTTVVEEKPTVVEEAVVPAETKAASVSSSKAKGEWAIEHSAAHTYADMAKITAGMLVGVLALMTFLLSVGLQHPKPLIRNFLYVSYATLGLSLLLYQVGVLFESRVSKKHAATDGKVAESRRQLGVVRVLQQLVFAAAVISTIGFAIAASQLFFVTAQPAAQPQTTTQGG